MKAHFTFIYEKPHPNRLVDLALAVTCAKQAGYDPVVYTNLDLPWLPAVVPVEYKPTKLWTRRKFEVYGMAPDGEPYLHLDSDVFLLKPLPIWLLNAPLFVQTDNEPKEWYGNIDEFPDDWKLRFMPNPWRAMCMGIFGGNPELVRRYAAFAEEGAAECEGKWKGHTISEQAALGRFVQVTGSRTACLSATLDYLPSGYRHLMAKKNAPDVRRWVERELRERDPELADQVLPILCARLVTPGITAGTVRNFYQNTPPRKGDFPVQVNPEAVTITVGAGGLGDCVVLSDLERTARQQGKEARVHTDSPHWWSLMAHVPGHKDRKFSWEFDALHEARHRGAGNGHIIQRIQRLCGLHVHPVPQGCIVPKGKVERLKNRICLHFEPSPGWAAEQGRTRHPRARRLAPQTRIELVSLIEQLPSDFSFVEVGWNPVLKHPRVEDATGRSLEETIRLMAECEYHIGIDSGPMHLATALGLKVICLINFPHPDALMLPVLVSTNIDEAWLYPQNVHVHQDVDSPHIPRATRNNLLRALQGGVYPYWSTEVASQLEEEMQ